MAAIVTRVNGRGIPAIKTIKYELSSTKLTLTFANHLNVSDSFQGLFLVYVTGLPAEKPSPAVPIFLTTEGYGVEKQLFTPQGAQVTTDEIAVGVYLCFYDSTTGLVRVMM